MNQSFQLLTNVLEDFNFQTRVEETDKIGDKVLVVGVHKDIPGLGYYNSKTQKYFGQEIDVAKAIADTLGYKKIHFVPVTTNNRVDYLLNDEVDFIAASCTINPNPPQGITYSDPYTKANGKILTLKSSLISKVRDLDHKTIGVMEDSMNYTQIKQYLKERNIRPTYVTYQSYKKMSQDFFEGNIDAVTLDEGFSHMYQAQYDLIEYDMNIKITSFNYGIMMKRESPLKDKVNEAIDILNSDHTMGIITKRWLSL